MVTVLQASAVRYKYSIRYLFLMQYKTQEQESAGQVARTIFEQVAALKVPELGFSFFSLSGAREFLYDGKSLQFRIAGKNAKGINKIIIRVNDLDLYDIEFWEVRTLRKDPFLICEKRDESLNVHVADMPGILARKTGMIS